MIGSSPSNGHSKKMTPAPPRISIGIPVFNGERFVAAALDSALAQTFSDFELIISDNGSTDRTEQICRSYAARDLRIRYYRNDVNRGAAWNHNRVVELARGDLFKWWSHDDLCAPNFLEACVSVLDRDPGIVLCFARAQLVDVEGRPLQRYESSMTRMDSAYPHQRFRGAIRQDVFCVEVYGLARTAVLRKTPLIASYTGSDRVLLADLALRGRFHEIPSYLFFNRDHPTRSIRAYAPHLVHEWFDPKLKGKIPLLRWRYLWEYGRAIAHSNLTGRERMRCYAQLPPWMCKYWRELAADFRVAGMLMVQKKSPRAGSMLYRITRAKTLKESNQERAYQATKKSIFLR